MPDQGPTGGAAGDKGTQEDDASSEDIGRAVAAAIAWTKREEVKVTPRMSRDHDTTTPVTVVLRPLASGLPFGFFALVVAATMLGAQALLVLPGRASLGIGLVLIPTAIAQFVAGLAAIPSRDVISATLMMVFSGVWLGTALVFIFSPPYGHGVLGVWYLALCPVIACLITAATAKLAVSVVPMSGLPTFLVTGIWLLVGGRDLGYAVGVLSFVLAATGLYAAVALLFEDARRHTVLPTLRRGPMKEAFTGDFESQLQDLEHEAGVRRFL